MKFISKNIVSTHKIAKKFIKQIDKNQTYILSGDLGGGKTTFVQGIGMALNINKRITSPTFVLMKIYKIKNNKHVNKVCHIDAYRIKDPEELINIGIEEYLSDDKCLTLIEWGEKVKTILPKHRTISFEIINKNSRKITIV